MRGSPCGEEDVEIRAMQSPTQPCRSLGIFGLLALFPKRLVVKLKGEGGGWTAVAAPESRGSIGELGLEAVCFKNDLGPAVAEDGLSCYFEVGDA